MLSITGSTSQSSSAAALALGGSLRPARAAGVSADVEDSDPLFDEAVKIVTESRRASVSGVQRRLKIGYNRAARMVEEMERIGIVTAADERGNREVLAPPPVEV